MFYRLTAGYPLGTVCRLKLLAVKVIVNKQWCMYYFTEASRERIAIQQSRVGFVDEEQAATVTQINI